MEHPPLPANVDDFMIEKTGRLTGIGIVLEFDAKTGYARILNIIPNSAALKAGIKKDDQVLSVNGERYKGKSLADMAYAIRGPKLCKTTVATTLRNIMKYIFGFLF